MPEQFWRCSLGEILDLLESRQRVRRQEAKEQISGYYELAGLIGLYIQKPYDGKNEIQIPHPWDSYPALFREEKEQHESQKSQTLLAEARNSRREYALRYNQIRSQGLY